MSNLEWALRYASWGWHVFPLAYKSKRPLTANGFKDATTDEETIRYWYENEPNAGIGIATGASGLVVLDFDKKNGGLETLDKLVSSLPETLVIGTGGGGCHYYYSGSARSRAGVMQGLDIRSTGGYVVAPPTIHESGERYEVVNNLPVVELPELLLNLISKPDPAPTATATTELPPGERGALNKRTLRFLAFGSKPGMWHQEFFQASMNLLQNGYTFEEAKEKLTKATGHLDESHDIPTLVDVYNNREPVYPPDLSEAPARETEEPPVRAAHDNESLVVSAASLASVMFAHLSDKAKVKGEPTLVDGLDAMLGGGKRTGEVTAWHAEAKTGKNTLWHKLMYLWASKASPIAMGYASRELTPETEVLPNLLSLAYKENAWLASIDAERTSRYTASLSAWPLYFASGYGYFPLDEIKRWTAALREKGVKFFWFDHLHYMLEDPEDHKAASKLIKEIKTMAKEEDIHVDIIIQPNKLAEGQRLSLNSIKGGSAMGQAVDNLLVLERVKGHRNISKLTLDVARSKLCKPGKIYLEYNPVTTDFLEVEPIEESQEAGWSKPYTLGVVRDGS